MSTSTSSLSSSNVACPRCKQPLIDPKGLGWCKACGYCRSLAETEAAVAPPSPLNTPPSALATTGGALAQSPIWLWITLFGVAAVLWGTFYVDRTVPMTEMERCLFCTIQIVAGAGLMFVGQIVGFMRVAPEDPSMSFWDVLFPFRLYGLVFKRLPYAQHAVYLGAWGLAAIIGAGCFVGGLNHWFTLLPKGNRTYEIDVIKGHPKRDIRH